MNTMTSQLRDALANLDRPRVEEIFQQAAVQQRSALQVAEELIVPALEQLGDDWSSGKVALSQIYMGSRICEDLVELVLPPTSPQRRSQPPHAIVVLNDYHMLGRRIVLSVLRASGFECLDYGRMEVGELVERIAADGIKILLVSVLMLPAALKVKALRAALAEKGLDVRIAVGGAPFLFDPGLWREVGADAMGRNAAEAVAITRRWMKEINP